MKLADFYKRTIATPKLNKFMLKIFSFIISREKSS